jgi:hypothetical protein
MSVKSISVTISWVVQNFVICIFRQTMKPKKIFTPGSYAIGKNKAKATKPTKKISRPGSAQKKKARCVKHREKYTEADMLEAVRLVNEDNFSISRAAQHINEDEPNAVPRMTLSDCLKSTDIANKPLDRSQVLSIINVIKTFEILFKKMRLGGGGQTFACDNCNVQELRKEVEEALVKCLEMCAEFNYPMRTRWLDNHPGRMWIRDLQRRWHHRVRVHRPTNIKRSRAKDSPTEASDFFDEIEPNMRGILRHCIYITMMKLASVTTRGWRTLFLAAAVSNMRRYKIIARPPSL